MSLEASIRLPLQQLMQKSVVDSNSLPNSVLSRQQADRFIDLVVDESVLMKEVRVVRIDHQKGEVNKLDLGGIVTEGAHTTYQASTHTPSERIMTYDTEKYRSAFDLKTDFTEDNIEKGGIRDRLLSMFTKQISNNVELAAISSDDSLPTGDAQTAENNLYGVNNGFQKILETIVPSAQVIDAGGAAPSKRLYYDMKRQVPSRYRAALPDYIWICPSGPADKWSLDVSDRETGMGDAAMGFNNLKSRRQAGPWGIPMLEVPLMPEDLSYGTLGAVDGSQIWLTPTQNLVYFIQRDITIEWDRKPRQDMWEATIHFRVDFQVENGDLVVMADNVAMSGSDYTG